MVDKIIGSILLGFSVVLKKLTIITVNSACWYAYGQEEEPKSLQRFKKTKDVEDSELKKP